MLPGSIGIGDEFSVICIFDVTELTIWTDRAVSLQVIPEKRQNPEVFDGFLFRFDLLSAVAAFNWHAVFLLPLGRWRRYTQRSHSYLERRTESSQILLKN